MMNSPRQSQFKTTHYAFIMLATAVMISILFLTHSVVQALNAPTIGDLSGSSIIVDRPVAGVGDTLQYTILISNSGDLATVFMTDTLPTSLTYVAGSLQVESSSGVIPNSSSTANGVIAWSALIGANAEASVKFSVTISDTVAKGSEITNRVSLYADSITAYKSVTTEIVSDSSTEGIDLSESEKTVSRVEAKPGDIVGYTLYLKNSGDQTAQNINLSDALPDHIQYVADSLSVPTVPGVITLSSDDSNNIISWSGLMEADADLTISFSAIVTGSIGDMMTNTMALIGGGPTIERSAVTKLVTNTNTIIYLPIIIEKYPPAPERPTITVEDLTGGSRTYTINWNSVELADTYRLEEDDNPDFDSPTVVYAGSRTSWEPDDARAHGTYYYRLQAINNDDGLSFSSRYSEVVLVDIGQFYADDTSLLVDQCTTLHWFFEGVNGIHVTFGKGYDETPVNGPDGEQKVCPSVTTVYTARIELEDAPDEEYEIVVEVNEDPNDPDDECGGDPYINHFRPVDSNDYVVKASGETIEIEWSFGCAKAAYLIIGNSSDIPLSGSSGDISEKVTKDTKFQLKLKNEDDDFIYVSFDVTVDD